MTTMTKRCLLGNFRSLVSMSHRCQSPCSIWCCCYYRMCDMWNRCGTLCGTLHFVLLKLKGQSWRFQNSHTALVLLGCDLYNVTILTNLVIIITSLSCICISQIQQQFTILLGASWCIDVGPPPSPSRGRGPTCPEAPQPIAPILHFHTYLEEQIFKDQLNLVRKWN